MRQFTYIGDCAAGFVTFQRVNEDPIMMPKGQPVEVPDWLAVKLRGNSHFEAVDHAEPRQASADQDDDKTEAACEKCGKIVALKKDGTPRKHDCNDAQ